MPRSLSEGGRQLLLQGRRRRRIPTGHSISNQQWSAVIQFSARHLFCPAHASPAPTLSAIVTRARTAGTPGRIVNAIYGSNHSTSAAQARSSIVSSMDDRRFFFAKRRSSTATALAADPPLFSSSVSQDHETYRLHYRDPGSQQNLLPASAFTVSARTCDPDLGTDAMHPTQLTTTASTYPAQSIVHNSLPNATSATKTPSSPSLLTTGRTVLKSDGDDRDASSWRFPYPLGAKDRRDTGPVQAWASTSEALSHFYNLLHQIKSSSISASASSTCSSALALQSALQHYAYLSHLQSVHNTILVPRKDARTLFLLQGRSHKTLKNLEALLRIAVDLIWLNEKGRSKRRHARRAAAAEGGVDIAHATSEPQTAPATDSVSSAARYIHSPADNHHGLRASEYAIIMNWIGSMSALETTAYSGSSSMDDNNDGSSGSDPSSTAHQHRVGGHIGALDRAWAIWQDLLLTGMKPDVVLYTVLMDQFLKAKEHSRANQIWDHMHPRDNDCHHHDEYVDTDNSRMQQEPSDSVSKPLSHGVGIHASSSSTRTTKLGFYSTDHGSTRTCTPKKHVSSVSENAIANVQMYSVLMQNHILNRDLQGVARMYQQLVRAADKSPDGAKSDSSGGGRRKAKGSARHAAPLPPLQVNTVIVNQILKVLVDLGDVKAAKEIYTEMKLHQGRHQQQHPDVTATARLSHGVAFTSPLSLTSTPLHHRAFRRRSTWLRKARAIALETSTIDHTSAPTTSIRPDKTTYRLMLGLAMRIGDEDLEQLVLDDLSLSILE